MHLSQISFSVPDIEPTGSFYQHCFKLAPSGEIPIIRGPMVSGFMGLSKVNCSFRFLKDDQDFLHLEFIRFKNPMPRSRPPDWRPCDIGISRLALKVRDFQNTLNLLSSFGAKPLTEPMEMEGTRRVCVYDPEDVLLEIIEAGVGEFPETACSRIAGVALSVPDIEAARCLYIKVLALFLVILNVDI